MRAKGHQPQPCHDGPALGHTPRGGVSCGRRRRGARREPSPALPVGEEETVFIAMNRFRIAKGSEPVFEELWGFREFHLLRGPSDEEATLYASHSVWESRAAFEAWTESESFHKAHAQARAPRGTYLEHPRFEGFDVVLSAARWPR